MKTEQHGSSTNYKERKRRLVEIILQDIKKGLKTMIDVQRMAKDIKRLAEETNTILTEIEETVLMTSINNQVINATNITQISEDLQYLVQSDMDKWAFQVQRMLADELDHYKGKGNFYIDSNIKEI